MLYVAPTRLDNSKQLADKRNSLLPNAKSPFFDQWARFRNQLLL